VGGVVAAADDGRDIDLFAAAQSQDDLDAAVQGLRPPRTDQHEVQTGRREFDTSIRGNPHFVKRLHRAHAVLDDRPVKLDSLVVGALDAHDDLIGRTATPSCNHCPLSGARAFSRWWNRSARNWAVGAGSNGGLILATKRPCGSITATAALCVTW